MTSLFSIVPAATMALALTASPALAGHFVTASFSLAPGGAKTLALPKTSQPIRVDVVVTPNNNAVQTPSELMSALMNSDPSSLQVTWIGTSSDASQAPGPRSARRRWPISAATR